MLLDGADDGGIAWIIDKPKQVAEAKCNLQRPRIGDEASDGSPQLVEEGLGPS